MSGEVVAFCTCPPGKGEELARHLVEEGLAACVNLLPEVRSFYKWQGSFQKDGEELLVIKTAERLFSELEIRIKELHPYEVPEVICMPITSGSAPYLAWLNSSLVNSDPVNR